MREPAIAALLARLASAYPWAAPPSRRLKLWSDVPAAMRPACFLHEGGAETYADAAGGSVGPFGSAGAPARPTRGRLGRPAAMAAMAAGGRARTASLPERTC